MSQLRLRLVVAIALLAAGGSVRAQSLSVVRGAHSETVTAAQLQAMPRVAAHVVQHDQPHDFEGVALASVLARVGVDVSKPLQGRDLAAAIRVTAADGYQVLLALCDIDPATKKAPVILADREAGKPLPAGQGPWRLVIGDDIRPVRAARQVERIEVLDLATSTKAAAAH